jgi:hypothetical protein
MFTARFLFDNLNLQNYSWEGEFEQLATKVLPEFA